MRLAPVLLLVACSNPLKVLGEDAADSAVVADVPVLAHFSDAMGNDGAVVSDLFADDLSMASAPDPTAWLTAEHDAHAALPDGTGRTLSLLTYNAGLLDRHYLVFHVAVPFIEERGARTGEEVFGAGHDIVFLQEVWELEDAERIQAAAEAAGYVVARPQEKQQQRETGLLVAARADLVGTDHGFEVVQYEAQWGSENFPGPNLKRGYVHWSFTLADDDVEVHLFDTHLTPFWDKWQTRNLQVRELGLAIADVPSSDIVLVGGDFNAGWYYPGDVWTDAEDKEYPGWWRNPTMPALLSYYGGVTDLANLAELVPEVERGDAVPTDTDATWLEEAYGDASLCDGADHFTATDCNSLYWTSYAATEFPARMDLMFLRDGSGRVRARSRSLAFVDPLDFGDAGTFELSDHFGQQVTIELLDE